MLLLVMRDFQLVLFLNVFDMVVILTKLAFLAKAYFGNDSLENLNSFMESAVGNHLFAFKLFTGKSAFSINNDG